MRRVMKAVVLIFAILCLVYGISIAVLGNGGTKFFLVWIDIAGILFVLLWMAQRGYLAHIPNFLKIVAAVVCAALFLSFVYVEGNIIRCMKTEEEQGLDYVIVLGAQVLNGKPSVVLQYRLDKAIEYLNDNPETICVVSGGKGKNEPYEEAYGMGRYLRENGIPKARLLFETESKTTEENLKNCRGMIPEDATVGIITNDFHMFRALQIAKKQGFAEASGIAAESTKYFLPNNMFREYLAEIKFLLRGMSSLVQSR